MDRVIEFLSGLPPAALYALLGLATLIEGVFPPAPSDLIVAAGAFLAARRGMNIYATIAVIVGGMTLGASIVYWLGRRFGSLWMRRQLRRFGVGPAGRRLEAMYGRYGLGAIFLGRFVPGLRMFVPAVAGMLRTPFVTAMTLIGVASLIWYGLIAALAYRVGSDWEMFRFAIERLLRRVGLTAAAFLVLAALIGWALWRMRKFRRESEPGSGRSGVED